MLVGWNFNRPVSEQSPDALPTVPSEISDNVNEENKAKQRENNGGGVVESDGEPNNSSEGESQRNESQRNESKRNADDDFDSLTPEKAPDRTGTGAAKEGTAATNETKIDGSEDRTSHKKKNKHDTKLKRRVLKIPPLTDGGNIDLIPDIISEASPKIELELLGFENFALGNQILRFNKRTGLIEFWMDEQWIPAGKFGLNSNSFSFSWDDDINDPRFLPVQKLLNAVRACELKITRGSEVVRYPLRDPISNPNALSRNGRIGAKRDLSKLIDCIAPLKHRTKIEFGEVSAKAPFRCEFIETNPKDPLQRLIKVAYLMIPKAPPKKKGSKDKSEENKSKPNLEPIPIEVALSLIHI